MYYANSILLALTIVWFHKVWGLCLKWIGISSAWINDFCGQFWQFYGLVGGHGVDLEGWMAGSLL